MAAIKMTEIGHIFFCYFCNLIFKNQYICLSVLKGKGKGRSVGPIQHCSLKADCTPAPEIVPSFISRGAPHQAA
jgi:hypothetical protein